MRYLFLICDDDTDVATRGDALLPAYAAFGEEAANAGVMRGGERLRPASTAATVRVRNGKTSTTDGPFAETKEQLGGFFILDCKDLDEAIAYAAKIPSAPFGSIEVRPIWEMG